MFFYVLLSIMFIYIFMNEFGMARIHNTATMIEKTFESHDIGAGTWGTHSGAENSQKADELFIPIFIDEAIRKIFDEKIKPPFTKNEYITENSLHFLSGEIAFLGAKITM